MRPSAERVQTNNQVKVRQFDPFAAENKNEGVSCCKPPQLLLPTDDITVKSKYKAAKARASTRNVDNARTYHQLNCDECLIRSKCS